MSVVQIWVGWGVELGILAINLVGSMRGGNDTVLSSAESEPDDHATLPRSKAMLASANASEKAKQDDGVHAITRLFGNLTFRHPKEYEGGARREPVGERLVSLIEPSINKKGRISCENVKVSGRDEEQESAHRKSGSSLVQCQGADCVSPTSASDDGDSSPRTEDDFKSSLSEKDQVKASSTGCQPQGPQPSKYHPTTPKQDREPTADLVESEGSDHLTPKATPKALPNVEEDEQDGTVHCIIDGLGHITLEGTQNPADDIKPKLEQEKRVQPPSLRIGYEGQVKTEEPEGPSMGGSAPQTPCSRGEDDYRHFLTSSGWHCLDNYRNVYAEDGALVHDALKSQLHETDPSFYIHGVPYWLDPEGLLSLDADSAFYCVRTWPNKYYFHTSNGWYFFDDYHNVYLEDGTLAHDGSSNAKMGGPLAPMFYIDGASYWFELDVLWCQASIDTLYRVHTWKSEPGHILSKLYGFYASDKFYYLDIRRNLYSKDGTLMYGGSSSVLTDTLHAPNFYIDGTPYWLHKNGLLCRSADGTICRVLAWVRDLCSLNDSPDPLGNGFKEGLLPFSPDPSSSSKLPNIIESTADGHEMPDTSLFAQSDPSYIQGMSTSSQHKTARKATKKAQPVRKRGTKDHLRCPICGKVNRRPVALKEHILTHTKEKPNICPFKGCTASFATRSNMKRHFDTHRAGCELEKYENCGLQATETASVSSVPYNPYKPTMPHHHNKHGTTSPPTNNVYLTGTAVHLVGHSTGTEML